MNDLIAFLRARLDEDETIARAATPWSWRHDPNKHWRKPGTTWFEEAVFAGPRGSEATCIAGTGDSDDPQSMADADHIARHDPDRVLADVAAKRQIIELHTRAEDGKCGTCRWEYRWFDGAGEWEVNVERDDFPCATLRLLALTHADHPDYRQEWRP